MEGIQTTLQEVLQWRETLAHPQIMHEECQEFVQDLWQRDIRGAGIQRGGQNHEERRFEVQERRRAVQDYQELPSRIQEYYQIHQERRFEART